MKITFITTVLNEESSISKLLASLQNQTKLPNEVVIVDGGSDDKTVERAKSFSAVFKKMGIKLSVLTRPGNRSIGRNEAINYSHGEIIVCSDAGCILDSRWVEKITEPFIDPNVSVVAGYYEGKAETPFQKALVPYVLVMQDKIDPNNFLPASRSMAFRKKKWAAVGGFPVAYSHNEDYVFAKTLQKMKVPIVFQKNAVVYWLPRQNIREAFTMFRRFAYGDAEANILRPKVGLIFLRYLLVLLLMWFALVTGKNIWLISLLPLFILYCLWAVQKNYRYVRSLWAFYYLPQLQLTSDLAVISGTIAGVFNNLWDTWVMQ